MKFRNLSTLTLMIITVLLLMFANRWDLLLANLFYENGFYLKDSSFVYITDAYSEYFVCGLFALVCGVWFLKKTKLSNISCFPLDFIDNKKMLFLTISFFGWCVAVPYSFKIIFNRARPYQLDIFGGSCGFSKAFELASCAGGDSFISGHTSFAMWLLALALIMPRNIQRICVTLALIIVLSVAFGRIIGGYHFLTDVCFAFLIVGAGICFTYKKMFISHGLEYKVAIA